MFRHVVLVRFVDGVTPEQRQAVLDGLASLPGQIPELRSYVVGTDAGVAAGNFDLAIVADFDDADGWLAYRDHPAHVAVLTERIAPILAERAAVQHLAP